MKVHSLLGLARFNQGLLVITFHRNVRCQLLGSAELLK